MVCFLSSGGDIKSLGCRRYSLRFLPGFIGQCLLQCKGKGAALIRDALLLCLQIVLDELLGGAGSHSDSPSELFHLFTETAAADIGLPIAVPV